MGYRVPTFNLNAGIWHQGSNPATDPPDVLTPCQLHFPQNTLGLMTPNTTGQFRGLVYLRVPAGTDIRFDATTFSPIETVEVPVGSGRFYMVSQVEDVAKGFDNEYRVALIYPKGPWSYPIP